MSNTPNNDGKYSVDESGIIRLNDSERRRQRQPRPDVPRQPYQQSAQPSYSQPYQQPYSQLYQQPYSQSYQQPYPQPYTYQRAEESNPCGVTGFVLSILSILFCWLPILSGILWLLGLIFSIVGMGKRPKELAVAGLVISLFFLVIGLLVLIFAYTFIAALFCL